VLATAHLCRGTHGTAISMALEAVRRYRETGNVSGRVDALVLLGRAQAASGEPLAAANAWAEAELITPLNDSRRDVVRGLLPADAERPVPAPRAADSIGPDNHYLTVADEVPEDVG
jgi:hypothetical protein